LELSSLIDFSEINPKASDIIVIPGFSMQNTIDYSRHFLFLNWLKNANARQTTICSICTGAFLLAKSGILDDQECTTHWRYIDTLGTVFPSLKVLDNRLFVKSKNIYTSAGVTTGIDLALFIIDERHGELSAIKIAEELAVYLRRSGTDEQKSVYLQFRNHQDRKIHTIQDWLFHNLEKSSTLETLAGLVYMSPRNLTRIFKKRTGVTINEYRTNLRIEKATNLLYNSGYKLDHVAQLCGFKSSKQLRAILEKK